MLALIGVHALAVALCFPATIVFEWGAGFTFGVWRGAAIVAASKTLGGLLGFALGRTLLHSWAAAAVARKRVLSAHSQTTGATCVLTYFEFSVFVFELFLKFDLNCLLM